MRIYATFKISLSDLVGHAFRSFLTALGVIFGVGAVVAMMAISEGAGKDEIASIEALGIDNIEVRSIKPAAAAGSSGSSMEYGITLRDINHIAKVFDNIKVVVPVRDTRKNVYVLGNRTDIQVAATTPDFLPLSRCELVGSRSRFLTSTDGENARPTCVLGADAARKLFSFADPMGQTISIGNASFKVVGLMINRYEAKMLGGRQVNNMVFIHIRTADSIFGKISLKQTGTSSEMSKVEADFLYVKVRDQSQIDNTAGRLRTYLAEVHSAKDYDVIVPYELLRQKEEALARSAVVLASIAAISLLVGGIGIMNIMMANIYERTKEIGTRRALGAKKRDIMVQFLSEAVLLTTIGGLVGLLLGWGLCGIVTNYVEWEPEITLFSIVTSMGVSVMIGIIFGTYPAWKAANLDPITALRSE